MWKMSGVNVLWVHKIQHLQKAHRAQMFDDVPLLIQNPIVMEEILHFHQQAEPFQFQQLAKPLPQHLSFH